MNNSITKVNTIEAICLIIIITINRIILNLPQLIIDTCSSSSILNIIYITFLAIIFVLLICKLFKNFSSSNIINVSEFVGGKFLKVIIAIILIIYLLTISATLLRNFAEILHILYYSETNIAVLIVFFIAVCMLSNFLGESAILRSNVIICIIMIGSLLITFLSVSPNIIFERIFPLLGYGSNQTFLNRNNQSTFI